MLMRPSVIFLTCFLDFVLVILRFCPPDSLCMVIFLVFLLIPPMLLILSELLRTVLISFLPLTVKISIMIGVFGCLMFSALGLVALLVSLLVSLIL